MEQIKEEEKIGIVLASVGLSVGSTWGMLREGTKGYEEISLQLKGVTGHEHMEVREVSNGLVVEMDEYFLKDSIKELEPKAVNSNVEEALDIRKRHEEMKFKAYLTELLGEEVTGAYKEEYISIYSIKGEMRLNGLSYPTFKLSLEEVIRILRTLNDDLQRRIYLNTQEYGFKPVNETTRDLEVLYSGLSISSTGTGVFMTLRLRGV